MVVGGILVPYVMVPYDKAHYHTNYRLPYGIVYRLWYYQRIYGTIEPIIRLIPFEVIFCSKLERLFSEKRDKRDIRVFSFELWNSIRKCHPKWDRLYSPFQRRWESEWSMKQQIEILNRGEILVNWKCNFKKISIWICTARYLGIKIQSNSQFDLVPWDTEKFDFLDFD